MESCPQAGSHGSGQMGTAAVPVTQGSRRWFPALQPTCGEHVSWHRPCAQTSGDAQSSLVEQRCPRTAAPPGAPPASSDGTLIVAPEAPFIATPALPEDPPLAT